ncbi:MULTISPECIES: hypothetical protein [unclassified Nostoc]|uniref:hypothetical protein n=1 Tax=unclassified Nostoc TaxID=2593658 RepID=UPI002AD42F43|nr:hypothetical protein [Nostoc sp. DedQUE03]MDZ7975210.1 hypothetical protein [Nostoc sp. DedQUE03]MDZ8048826.1 hypothetical protein [Nostoc sp. DedQUE02]
MAKQLLLVIQSDNPGLYVNILTHCIQVRGIRDVYFGVNEGAVGKLSEVKEQIRKIRDKFEELLTVHNEYQIAYNSILSLAPIEERIIKILFVNPEASIKNIKRNFLDLDNLIVDISGCNKKVSSDIISSYISSGIKHVCCFELDDRVYSKEWRTKGLSKMYHDIHQDIVCYEYIDFSESGTTIESFNRMRSQGKVIKLLLVLSIFLGVMVFVLIQQQQSVLAQYAAVTLALITGLGLVNDIFGVVDRLK